MIGRVNQFLPEYLKRQELRREYESPTFDGINTEALIKNPQLRVVVLAILGLFLSGCVENTTTSRDLAQALKAPSGTISNEDEVGNFVQANPNNESATNIQREGENHMTETAPHLLPKGYRRKKKDPTTLSIHDNKGKTYEHKIVVQEKDSIIDYRKEARMARQQIVVNSQEDTNTLTSNNK